MSEHPKVTNHSDDYACGLCWHAVNIHNLAKGCPVAKCRCMASPGEASNAWTESTPDPLPQGRIRPGYAYQEADMTPKAEQITDAAGRAWTWVEERGRWISDVGQIFWNEADPQRWFLDIPNVGGSIDLHETTIKPAIRAAQEHLPKVHTITDVAGRVWTYQEGDKFWFTPLVGGGEARLVAQGGGSWLLGTPEGKQFQTSARSIGNAIEDVQDSFLKDLPIPGVPAVEDPSVVQKKALAEALKDNPWGNVLRTFGMLPAEEEPTGVWLVTTTSDNVQVFANEIEALRVVNASDRDEKAFFVPFGSYLSDARGW